MRVIIFFLNTIILLGLIPVHSLHAQQSGEMLLFEIDSNRYEKRNFNKQDQLQSSQKLIVGSIEETEDIYRLALELYSYNAEGELQDSTKTTYSCRPDEQQVLLNIFPFSDYGNGNEIKVKLLDTNTFYPIAPELGWEMEPIEFALNIDKGLVGFLGGKSKINIYERRVVSNDTLQTGQYEINSQVNFSVFVLGIKMKEIAFQVIEIIDKDRGIIWQKFTRKDDDSYFVIRLI